MKEHVTLYYEDALEFAQGVKVAILKELGYDYSNISDSLASGVDYVTQEEADKLFI